MVAAVLLPALPAVASAQATPAARLEAGYVSIYHEGGYTLSAGIAAQPVSLSSTVSVTFWANASFERAGVHTNSAISRSLFGLGGSAQFVFGLGHTATGALVEAHGEVIRNENGDYVGGMVNPGAGSPPVPSDARGATATGLEFGLSAGLIRRLSAQTHAGIVFDVAKQNLFRGAASLVISIRAIVAVAI